MPGAIMTGLQRSIPDEELQDMGWSDENGNRRELPGSNSSSPSRSGMP
jgi:hypothetical protein